MSSAAKPFSLESRPVPDLAAVEALRTGDFPMSLSREATVRWLGHPPAGEPRMTVGSHALNPAATVNVDLALAHPLSTSPGELLAGGFGIVFATVLANQLVRDQTQASELVVQVAFMLSQDGPGIDPALREIRCDLEARVPGVGQPQLAELGEQALRRTIESLAINADAISISLTISLLGDDLKRPARGPGSTSSRPAAVPAGTRPSGTSIANGQIA